MLSQLPARFTFSLNYMSITIIRCGNMWQSYVYIVHMNVYVYVYELV